MVSSSGFDKEAHPVVEYRKKTTRNTERIKRLLFILLLTLEKRIPSQKVQLDRKDVKIKKNIP
jgi:hypothetical protein